MSNSPSDASHSDVRNSKSAYRQQLRRLDELINRGGTLSGHERNCAFLRIPPDSMGDAQIRRSHSPQFATVSHVSGFGYADDGRSIALTDWDDDGDLDVWVMNRTAPRVRFLRNDLKSQSSYIKFRLIGMTSNRDGIGARVSVERNGEPTQWKTLRAGEGFLSQSSKELHFGLGPGEINDAVVSVRWPTGGRQVFRNLKVNCTHLIREGDKNTGILPKSHGSARSDFPTATKEPTHTSESAAIALVSRIPVPRLPYVTEGKNRNINVDSGRPVLVNLWASWCIPCREELAQLDEHAKRLEASGLDVVALSVDAIPSAGSSAVDTSTAEDAARQIMKSKPWSIELAMATKELIGRFQFLENDLFAQDREIVIPTSYLIDGRGRLAAIYRGPVEVERLQRDLGRLLTDQGLQHFAALPFPGKWFHPRSKSPTIRLVNVMAQQNRYSDAASYLLNHESELSVQGGFVTLAGKLGTQLVRANQFDQAISLFRVASVKEPSNVPIVNNLAWYLISKPNVSQSEIAESLKWARHAANLTKLKSLPVLDTLAKAQELSGNDSAAISTLRLSIQLAESDGDTDLASKLRLRVQQLKQQ